MALRNNGIAYATVHMLGTTKSAPLNQTEIEINTVHIAHNFHTTSRSIGMKGDIYKFNLYSCVV